MNKIGLFKILSLIFTSSLALFIKGNIVFIRQHFIKVNQEL